MKEKKCWECKSPMKEFVGIDSHGVSYRYWECTKCKDRVLDMEQLHEAAEQYRKLKRAHSVTVSKWGTALAFRIPKEIVISQRIKPGEKVRIQEEKVGFKVVLEK
jgi:hypothetical protein